MLLSIAIHILPQHKSFQYNTANLAAYGHMGREDLNAPWEKCDLVDALKAAL